MNFSVIYSIDVPGGTIIDRYYPPDASLWMETEDDRESEYSYLGGDWEEGGQHRKYCALLTRDEFDAFVRHVGIWAEDVETMGSLGAPGFDFALAPAISFTSHDGEAILSAYVTPLPSFRPTKRGDDRAWQDRAWERLKGAILAVYR